MEQMTTESLHGHKQRWVDNLSICYTKEGDRIQHHLHCSLLQPFNVLNEARYTDMESKYNVVADLGEMRREQMGREDKVR